ncbi:MAG: metal-sensitive transcriptional regulator [Deltaproteobacteria bacterium]|nr:metal-sensitive transcriptional regulator [Deltaproteobacteria bacterium]
MHPNHEEQIQRLNKIEGQVKGIKKMIEERRYCIDILTQTKAVTSAISKVELGILRTHILHCLKHAVQEKDQAVIDEKIQEIMKIIQLQI